MPSKSQAQANLMRAAAHGATFPKAKALRAHMTLKQLADFSKVSPSAPKHVAKR